MAHDTAPPRSATRWARFPLLLVVAIAPRAAAGTPYAPTDDREVLETLPSELFAGRDELAALRGRLAAAPDDPATAAEVSRRYIALGKSGGGPRCFGYARSAVAPWWDDTDAPLEVCKVRAKLEESDHRYREALAGLKEVLRRDPRDIQAWVEVASIHRTLGEYDESRRACDALARVAQGTPVLVARVPLLAATGHAEEAFRLLDEALTDARKNLPAIVPWVLTVRAEVARSLGFWEQADSLYREAQGADPRDGYLRRAYADFLLDRRRHGEALALLREDLTDNGALLAAAIAARRDGRDELSADYARRLQERFDETRLRGDQPHGRFEARYYLELRDDPSRALEVALQTWEQQKELRDARTVLEAALAAERPDAAEPVAAFLRANKTQDVMVERLLDRLDEARGAAR